MMKKEYYALYFEVNDSNEDGFCSIDPDEGNEIGTLEEILATKDSLENIYKEVRYKVVKLTAEAIE